MAHQVLPPLAHNAIEPVQCLRLSDNAAEPTGPACRPVGVEVEVDRCKLIFAGPWDAPGNGN
eukprot:8659498-Prorocentrum_lima.AAC.1